jgi:Tetratricopeptide repeat
MAALRVIEESPNQLVLGTPVANRIPNLITFAVFVLVGYWFLSGLMQGGLVEDPTSILVLLFFAYFGLRSISSILVTTIVRVDATSRTASRTRRLLGLPIGQTALPLERVRRVVVGSRAPVAFNQARTRSGWSVVLDAADAPSFVVNSNGNHDEMIALGNKVASVTGKPLTDELEQARSQMPAPSDLQPIQDFGRGSSASYAPPVAMPSPLGRSIPSSTLPEKLPPANTLTRDSESPDHARFEQDANEPAIVPADMGSMGEGMPPMTYSAPPALELPDQPPLESMATMPKEIPSVPSAIEERRPSMASPRRTLEELRKAVSDDPTDGAAYYQLARMLQTRGAYDQALEMYQNAARLDPMNGSMQNDLGVLYFQRGKLKDAELAFRRAVGLDPFSVSNHYNLGLLLARTGRRKGAEQEFNRVQQNASTDREQRLAADAIAGRMSAPMLSVEG